LNAEFFFEISIQKKSSMTTKSIKIDNLPKKIGLLAAVLLCILGIVFFVKWCLANVIASNANFGELAELTLSLAPNDPQTHYTSAVLLEKTFSSDDLSKSLAEYEQATALAPGDYRTWRALGKVRSRIGDMAGAEQAFRKALELAPNYSEIRWILGNHLLRQGKTPEAFIEIRQAAESDPNFVNPTALTAWQIFGGNLQKISQYIGDSAPVNSALVVFLAKEKRFDEAMRIWNSLPAVQKKKDFKENGDALFNQMLEAKRYRDALLIQSEIGDASEQSFAVGEILNGGFETDVKITGASLFDWQIEEGMQPQIGVDNSQKHGGNRSLVVIFNSATGRDFRKFSQTIAVEAGKKYGFEMFYKSELKTAATVYWEIANVTDGKILTQTPPLSTASDWTNLKTEFTVPQNTEAIVIRLARETCKDTLCPISGRVWFDDLTLTQ
jgi:tetratricopeptide (TPR) repeat protein